MSMRPSAMPFERVRRLLASSGSATARRSSPASRRSGRRRSGSAARRAAWSARAPRPACRRRPRRTPRAARLRSCRSRRRRRPGGPSACRAVRSSITASIAAAWSARFLERKAFGERLVVVLLELERVALARGALRVEVEQLGRGVAHLLRGLALRLFPLAAAERVQRRLLGRGAAVAADQMQLRDRHVELVAVRVLERAGTRSSPSPRSMLMQPE